VALDGVKAVDAKKEAVAKGLYAKFAEQFPDFAEGKYSHMRLEAGDGMMPLSTLHHQKLLMSI